MRADFRVSRLLLDLALRLGAAATCLAWTPPAWSAPQATRIEIDANGPPANRFRSQDAFGASLDGGEKGEVLPTYTAHNISRMRAAGLSRVSYRLRTELGIEVWHWTDRGRWSDAAHRQGYWTGDPTPRPRQTLTWGYKLPRRGDTVDNANNSDFSRLDDGDPTSFWKSNPYLDPRLSHAPKASPQWAVIDLGKPMPIDGLRVTWGTPYARRYVVQYWVGRDEGDDEGRWIPFETGRVEDGRGGDVTLHLADKPVTVRFMRLLMLAPSGTAPAGATDPRDGMGYAVAELYAGTFDAKGALQDVIRHGVTRQTQSVTTVSSTDPWHRAIDKDLDLEQVAPQFMVKSGITNGLPLMIPVGTFYDTPENAAAELEYLKNAKVPFNQVELGEEPDGQLVDGADYGALYLAFYDRLHAEFPGVTFGGPSLQSGVTNTWLNDNPIHSWNGQFIAYLKARGRLDALGFFSFERYPFDDICGSLPDKLMMQSGMMAGLMKRVAAEGTPTTIPWIISEYGFSAFSGRAMVEMPSALLNADMVADFFTRGGDAAYLFGYGPSVPINQHLACAGQGNMMLWQADENGAARWPMPAFYESRMLSQDWAEPGAELNLLYRAEPSLKDAAGTPIVTAYPLRRPDGRWAVMLINRGTGPVRASLAFKGQGPRGKRVEVVQYSGAQYAWDPERLRPAKTLPPARSWRRGWDAPINLPALSLTVVRG